MLLFAGFPLPGALMDMYKNKPWKTQEEYQALTRRYGLFGGDLERKIKQEEKKSKLLIPILHPPKHIY